MFCFFFSGRRRHTRFSRDWSSDVCSSDLDPLPEGTSVSIAVRPEKIDVHEAPPPRGTAATENVVEGRVADVAYLGDVSIYRVKTASGAIIRVQETHVARSSEPHYDWDDTLWLSWEAASAVVLTA